MLGGKNPTDWRRSPFHSYGGGNHDGIRTGRSTYLKLAGHPPELFDRQLDPSQSLNVAAEPENKPVLERLEKELKKQIMEVDISASELPKSARDEKPKRKAGGKKPDAQRDQSRKLQQ